MGALGGEGKSRGKPSPKGYDTPRDVTSGHLEKLRKVDKPSGFQIIGVITARILGKKKEK